MSYDSPSHKFKEYLKKINDITDDKCWFCHKTPDQIREEFFEYMKNPSEEYEELEIEDIAIMTYHTQKPICAACYVAIKQNPDLVQEVLDKPEDEVWY